MPSFMGNHTSIKTELNVPAIMRDGIRLFADVYRPDTDKKVPVLLQRTPYNKDVGNTRVSNVDALRAASHGYDPLRFCHLQVNSSYNWRHFPGYCSCNNH